MNSKNQQKTERFETSFSTNSYAIDIDAWARAVKSQMMTVLNKKKARRKTKLSS